MLTLILAVSLWAQTAWKPADPAVACTDAKDKTLCAELLAIRDRDQEVRHRMIADTKNEQLQAEVAAVDRQNIARVDAIIAAHGWPGSALVGRAAVGAAWTVIQHADLETQKKYLGLMTKAVESGDLEPALYGTTIDRIRIREGKPQLYGTQFRDVNGVKVPEPIEDEMNVDARRAKMGMTSLAQYAEDLGQAYGKPAAVSPIIARECRGRVATSRADEYTKYLDEEGLRKIRGIAGNLGVQMLKRTEGDVTEFVVISYWPSRAAIRAFAGEDIEKAHFLPRDREYLINPDEHVRHYEVTLETWAKR